ncbi:MAG: mechanosensitive ion channel [Alphaproteobacteria bacterium]|nr:mechanosensitive ion channel [Alphaproteobacteria bacterium]MBQ3163406.1 mechanosensitive ion channel [Lachnospiraceae bacterium]MBQ6996107.1 mechanosensitive ion channel [Lachnospiraceae bacterium]
MTQEELIELNKSMNALEKFIADLPEKALNLGIRVLIAAVILFIGFKLIKFIRKILKKSLSKASIELGVIQFLDSLLKVILNFILVLIVAGNFGFDATSIVALMGSAGVAVGLALQGSLSNIAGGILILLLKPFRVGDYIIEDSNGNEGTVKEIGIFFTKLQTGDNKIVILPNGSLANNSMTNFSEAHLRRVDVTVGISYDADIKKAKDILWRIIDEDADVKQDDTKRVYVDSLGASEVVLGLRVYCENAKYWELKWRLLETIKLAFDEEGIEIPYQKLDVHILKEENS